MTASSTLATTCAGSALRASPEPPPCLQAGNAKVSAPSAQAPA